MIKRFAIGKNENGIPNKARKIINAAEDFVPKGMNAYVINTNPKKLKINKSFNLNEFNMQGVMNFIIIVTAPIIAVHCPMIFNGYPISVIRRGSAMDRI